jgi:DNA-binding XRE family transcriptional regulator
VGTIIGFPAGRRSAPERLWRQVAGEYLRDVRCDRGERITDVAERAGISPQYLSELERGRKDPSSEVLSAVTGALGTTVQELSRWVAHRYAAAPAAMEPVPAGGPAARPAGPAARPSGPVCLAA